MKWIAALFLFLSLAYLAPGVGYLFSQRTDRVLSDGTDPATLPYTYAVILDHWHKSPINLFFGAVPTDKLNPPEGFALWIPWSEKFLIILGSYLFPVEQLSTFFLLVMFICSGLSFFLMAQTMGWHRGLATALSICWAFNAYSLARAKVHFGLVALYHLPLIIFALYLIKHRQDRKSLAWATGALLIASTTAHYNLIITAFLTPFFVWYIFAEASERQNWQRLSLRTVLAALPAVFLVAWCYIKPLPQAYVKENTIAMIKTGEAAPGQYHQFLDRFSTHFIDYFTGVIAVSTSDINPLRMLISDSVVKNMGEANTHERSNGVRWLIWLAVGAFTYLLFSQKRDEYFSSSVKTNAYFWLAWTGFCIWLSFTPEYFGFPGPSAWLSKLVSQFRVPSRAGIFAQFGLLMLAGIFLQAWLFGENQSGNKKKAVGGLSGWQPKLRRYIRSSVLLVGLVIIELPPFMYELPTSPVVARRSDLADGQPCGSGLYYPYVSGTWGLAEYYYFLQSMRGSQCAIVNAVTDTISDRNRRLMQTMPLHPKYLEIINRDATPHVNNLVGLAHCVPFDWYVFDPKLPADFKAKVCSQLGWQMTSADTCRSGARVRPAQKTVEECWR